MSYRLFVVDDEKIYRSSLAGLLRRELPRFAVVEAANGQEALERMEQEPADCLLLDIRMPKMDGMGLLAEMDRRGMARVPTVIVSGYNDFAYARSAIQYDVFDYLLKPITPDEALDMARKLLARLDEAARQREALSRLERTAEQALPLIRAQLLHALTAERFDPDTVREQAALLGLSLAGPWFCCAVLAAEQPFSALALEGLEAAREKPGDCIVFSVHDQLVMLLFSGGVSGGDRPAKRTCEIAGRLREMGFVLSVGVGGWHSGLSAVSHSYEEALRAQTETARAQAQSQGHVTELVRQYIEAHFADALSNAELAGAMGYSANYLSQVFKSETGIGLKEYIRDVRVRHAKLLLRQTAYKVTDIAAMVGFSNDQYFCTMFRKSVGVTPKEYREQKEHAATP